MSLEKISAKFPNGILRSAHPYYMYAAIYDIPGCLEACLERQQLNDLRHFTQKLKPARVFITRCGTSYNASQAIAYTFRSLLGLPAVALDALDCQLEPPPGMDGQSLLIAVSHSGQNLPTCIALENARENGVATIGLTAMLNSRITKSADFVIIDPYHKEYPFGKTRSYLSSVMQGMLVAAALADPGTLNTLADQAMHMAGTIRKNLTLWENHSRQVAVTWASRINRYTLAGFGIQAANCLEIALKFIEVTGESAIGFALEELAHGPSASFREDMGFILYQTDPKVLARSQQIVSAIAYSRASQVIITNEMKTGWPETVHVIPLPALEGFPQLAFFPAAVASQCLLYFLAVEKGMNPDINGKDRYPELDIVYDMLFPPGSH